MDKGWVFGLFDNRHPVVHIAALSFGAVILPLVLLTNYSQSIIGIEAPAVTVLAGIATGVYYGLAYAVAFGSPTWNLMLPGLAIEIGSGVLDTAGLELPIKPTPDIVTTLIAYLGVIGVVAIWHSHLGTEMDQWVGKNFPKEIVSFYEEKKND